MKNAVTSFDNIIGYAEHDNFKLSQGSRVTKAHTRRKNSNLYDIERERERDRQDPPSKT